MKRYSNTAMNAQSTTGLIVILLLILASCSSKNEGLSAENAPNNENVYELTATQFKSSEMKLGKLEMRPFHEIVKANGVFDVPPGNQAAVSSYFGGTVKNIQLLPGDRVKKGQVLFVLENPEYVQMQQDFLEAKGQLSYLKADYERQKNLVQDNVTSQKNYLKAESDYTVTKVKAESLKKKLALMNISADDLTIDNLRTTINVTSPIDGYVTEVNVSRGIYLTPSQVAIAIMDTNHMHVELSIFERDLMKVKVGQAIKFSIQDDSKMYDATVYLVNKAVDLEKRTITLHGHLADESIIQKFNPGMYVQADIFTTSVSKMSLPHDAVVEIEGTYWILELKSTSNDGHIFTKKEVKIGAAGNDFIEILNASDFGSNAEFLVKGAFNLITE